MRFFGNIEISRQTQAGRYAVPQDEFVDFARRFDRRAGVARTKGVLTNPRGETVLEIVTTGLFAKRPAPGAEAGGDPCRR